MHSLTETYRPLSLDEFAGLEKPKRIISRLIAQPFESAWLFLGPSGTGKTSMALTLADAIPAQLHHIPSQKCTLEGIERIAHACRYYPEPGKLFHVVLIDEADQMSRAAQIALLSMLDATAFPQKTIFVFTANSDDGLEARFLSRLRTIEFSSYGISSDAVALLSRIWAREANGAPLPNIARIVKEANNNIRASLMKLETELLMQ